MAEPPLRKCGCHSLSWRPKEAATESPLSEAYGFGGGLGHRGRVEALEIFVHLALELFIQWRVAIVDNKVSLLEIGIPDEFITINRGFIHDF